MGGISPKEFHVMDYGAKGNNSDDDSAAIQRAIDAAKANVPNGENFKVMFPSGKVFYIASPIVINQNGCILDLQGCTIKARSNWAGTGMICIARNDATGTGDGDTELNDFHMWEGIIDMNGEDCYGITNFYNATYNPGGFASGNDHKMKYGGIMSVRFKSNAAGYHMAALRNLENMWDIFHCEFDRHQSSGASPTAGLYIEMDDHNGGNLTVSHTKVSAHPDSRSARSIWLNAESKPFNRAHIHHNHLFNNNGAGNADNIGLYVEYDDGGGVNNNRSLMVDHNGIEDYFKQIYVVGASGSGGQGLMIDHNSLENKNGSSSGNTYAADSILIHVDTRTSGVIDHNFLHVRSAGSDTFTGIQIDSTDDWICSENMFLDTNPGSGTFTKFAGAGLDDDVVITGNMGYNDDYTTISSPWHSGLKLTDTVSGGSSSPTASSTYTVYGSPKRVIVSGASTITINGTNAGSTAGSWVLKHGETIRFTGSPSTAVVQRV